MLETLRNAWVIKDIRKKIFFTIFIILFSVRVVDTIETIANTIETMPTTSETIDKANSITSSFSFFIIIAHF